MKFLFASLVLGIVLSSCGPSAEDIEKQRIQDSIKAEEERLSAIEDADAFITESTSDTLAEIPSDTVK